MKRVTFVCSGNVFRSLSAKVCLEDYFKKNKINGIIVDSAGIFKPEEGVSPITKNRLNKHGVFFTHRPKKITRALVNKSDLVISMEENHQKFLKEHFDINSPLFEKIAYGKNKGILDISEKYPFLLGFSPIERAKQRYYRKRIDDVVDEIYRATPKVAENLMKIFGMKN